MDRLRHGCLSCFTFLLEGTSSSQTLNEVAYCKECDSKICSEMYLADKILMDVFAIVRGEEEASKISQAPSMQAYGGTKR